VVQASGLAHTYLYAASSWRSVLCSCPDERAVHQLVTEMTLQHSPELNYEGRDALQRKLSVRIAGAWYAGDTEERSTARKFSQFDSKCTP
jgi:hypothetical protein